MEKGFAKDVNLIAETSRTEDKLNFSASINDFKKYLDDITNHALVGVIGEFGTGKSTMLYQIEKENKNQWFVFDAWAFPNRKDLWEGFVIDFAKEMCPSDFIKIKRRIDGQGMIDIKNFFKTIAIGVDLFLVSGIGVLGRSLANLFKSSSVKRIFEFKEILVGLIEKSDRDLYLVLEDVDRSGSEGAVFLETIKKFIENDLVIYKKHKVILIAPIGTEKYKEATLRESYDKSLDFRYQFKPQINFVNFISEIFMEDLFIENNNHWRNQLEELFKFFMRNHTVRDLKRMLRHANHKFCCQKLIENFKPDPRMTILMEVYYENQEIVSNLSINNGFEKYPGISANEDFYEKFCIAISENIIFEQAKGYKSPNVIFVQNHNITVPQRLRDSFYDQEYTIKISDLYL